MGLFSLVFAAFMVGMRSLLPPEARDKQSLLGTIIIAIVYLILAVIFFVMAYGTLRKRNWGRILSIVISSCWLAFGVLVVVIYAVVLPTILPEIQSQQRTGAPEVNMGVVLGILFTFMIAFGVAIPLVLLFFYTRPSVKATFLQGVPQKQGGFPVVIGVLMFLYALAALSMFFVLFNPHGTILFAMVLPRWPAKLYFVVMLVACAYIIYAMYKRRKAGWSLALGFTLFGLASGLVTSIFGGDPIELYRRMGMTEQELDMFRRMPAFAKAINLFSYVMVGIHLALLAAARKYFDAPAVTTPAYEVPAVAPPPPPTDLGPAM